jgi:S-DNA-T family DNA segregation ATPase FtsK/SpoIIIE
MVHLREILESEAFQKRRSSLMLALGKDVSGNPWVVDLERMPHLLVAGATGSGKSVALNSIILSLLYQNNPSDLKFVLVDPKRVEFPAYQHIPHLLTPVITEVPATINALKWLLKEMDRRFNQLASSGERNIQSYNQHSSEKLPYIIIIIDELADLMVAAASEVEGAVIRLAQMARAVGLHLILATQRPSVDVITGLIKANITARVAFAVASLMDSRTILDTGGAEKLIGRGDMLYISSEVTKPKRLQGALVDDEEIQRVVNYLKSRAAPEYVAEVTAKQAGPGWGGGSDDDDPLFGEAEAVVVQAGKASASLLQRRLKVGYARAARLLDLLEAKGIIGPGDGAKPRDVLISRLDSDMIGVSSDDYENDSEDQNNEI